MAAGPIGSHWAPGSWSDTCWEAFTWSSRVQPQPDTGVSRHTPPRMRPAMPPVRARIRWVLGPFETASQIQVTVPTVTAFVATEFAFRPSASLDMAIQAPSVSATMRTMVMELSSKSAITSTRHKLISKTVQAVIHSTIPAIRGRGTIRTS